MNLKIPLSPSPMRELFLNVGEKLREQIRGDLRLRLQNNEQFSLSVDEWSSFVMDGYIALELLVKDKVRYNLGMRKIDTVECLTLQHNNDQQSNFSFLSD